MSFRREICLCKIFDRHAQILTNAATGAGSPATIAGKLSCRRSFPLVPQKMFADSGRSVRPRQRFIKIPLAFGEIFRIYAASFKSLFPQIEFKQIRPAVKFRSESPSRFDDFRKPAISSRNRSFQNRKFRIVIIVNYRPVPDKTFQKLLPPVKFFKRNLPETLKRRKRFRDKAGHADGNLYAAFAFNICVQIDNFFCKVGNPGNVLIGFCGKSDHKIKLDGFPPLVESRRTSVKQIFFGNAFVYDISKSLRPRLRCKGQSALPDGLHFVGKVNGKAVNPERRQGKTYFLVAKLKHQIVD